MGGSESKNSTEIIQESVSNVLFETIQDCSVSATGNQIFEMQGCNNVHYTDVDMMQVIKFDVTCLQGSDVDVDIQNKIIADLKQKAETESVALLGALNSDGSVNEATIRSSVENNITNSVIQNCVSHIDLNQTVGCYDSNDSSATNIKMDQFSETLMSCDQYSSAMAAIVNDLGAQSDQDGSTVVKGPLDSFFDMIGDIFDAGMMLWVIGMLVVLVFACGSAYIMYKKGKFPNMKFGNNFDDLFENQQQQQSSEQFDNSMHPGPYQQQPQQYYDQPQQYYD
jgi:hypothetical protein